jgi:hypothetical protein
MVARASITVPVGVPAPRLDEVRPEALSDVRVVVGREKAHQRVGRGVERGRIERQERPRQEPGGGIELGRRVDEHPQGGALVEPRGVELPALRHVHDDVAKAEVPQLQGRPVEVGVELLGHHHVLGWGRGLGVVLEVDDVGEQPFRLEELVRPEAAGPEDLVRVVRAHLRGEQPVDEAMGRKPNPAEPEPNKGSGPPGVPSEWARAHHPTVG